jgi:hypothetical protein
MVWNWSLQDFQREILFDTGIPLSYQIFQLIFSKLSFLVDSYLPRFLVWHSLFKPRKGKSEKKTVCVSQSKIV